MATTSFLSPKLETLIKSALAGDTYAQNRLGDLYREGDEVEQNYSEALQWYQRAADEGDSNGQNNVGTMYLNGLGAEPNPEKAVKYFRLAAEQDLPVAQYNLAERYSVLAAIKHLEHPPIWSYNSGSCSPAASSRGA